MAQLQQVLHGPSSGAVAGAVDWSAAASWAVAADSWSTSEMSTACAFVARTPPTGRHR